MMPFNTHLGGGLVAIVIACAVLSFFFAFRRDYYARRTDVRNHTYFKEPGCGHWMSHVVEEWYALSDAGGYYAGPWPTVHQALLATAGSAEFLEEYGVEAKDVEVPEWRADENAWGNNWGICNIMSSKNLYAFWSADVGEMVEVR